eukprot:TRINITY_DN290_c0_g1_i2.p1 TRINITY_DN290_c0_g1~~TRINITY_DN290_c0_g1_i2.p1  ORF type:complete len:124 (+),score=30.33 TRINITY_DN290_c0_g1_i2:19-390(+)
MSRPARVLGRPDSEDEDTRGMSAQQIYDMRQQKLDEQDNDLDQILASVRRQKEVGIAIGAETDDQLKLLGRLDGSVEREDARIKTTTDRVDKLMVESSTKCLWITICLLIVILVIVVALAIET